MSGMSRRTRPVLSRRFRRELATAARRTPAAPSSIFLGGGTPSLMEPSTVAAVLEAIAGLWTVTGIAR